jgi:ABC-type multidrug transport system permease subunit
MRWLLLKDLQILRRSPLLVGLLVIYPVAIAVLIGVALSRSPDRPKVALLNQVPAEDRVFSLAGQRVDLSAYADQLFEAIDPITVHTRTQALEKVRSGQALAALIIPPDITRKLGTGGLERPTVSVVYSGTDPLKRRYVEQAITSRLADANLALSSRLLKVAGEDISLLATGGSFSLPFGNDVQILGLRRSADILRAAIARLPRSSPDRAALGQVQRFAEVALQNLDFSRPVLQSVSAPVRVQRTVLEGKRTPLNSFAVAVAVTISLMFVAVLMAAGMLALEREEHAFARLVRGLVSRSGLLAEKAALAAALALVVSLLMLAGIGIFVSLDWARFPLWVLGAAGGAVAFGSLGVAIGGLAREVRAASLLAFLLSLPVAFLALVPSGAVSSGLYDVVRVVSAIFPFKAALDAMTRALAGGQPSLLGPLAHLLGLAVAFGVIARLALRRFA